MKRKLFLIGTFAAPIQGSWMGNLHLQLQNHRGGSATPSASSSSYSDHEEIISLAATESSNKTPDSEDLSSEASPDHLISENSEAENNMINDSSTSSVESDPNQSEEIDKDGDGIEEKSAVEIYARLQKRRSASEFLTNLIARSGIDSDPDSQQLRRMISERVDTYFQGMEADPKSITSPTDFLLHYLAPKIPAIKHLPEISLRVQSRREDRDPGIAACLVGALAHAQEVYERQSNDDQLKKPLKRRRKFFRSSDTKIIEERRFEQLVECILCGMDVSRRKDELKKLDDDVSTLDSSNVEDILDQSGASLTYSPGLTIRDACRAAWGFAVLGLHQCEKVGGEDPSEIFIALSLRARELLMARLESLRRDDLSSDFGDDSLSSLPLDERISIRAEELAEDVATALWAFACVKACTGIRSVPLFEVCASILCQDPVDLRRRAQEELTEESTVGGNDVVDRLEMAEIESVNNPLDSESTDMADSLELGHVLLDKLSAQEMVDVLWSVALHDNKDKEEPVLSENISHLSELAFDRVVMMLDTEKANLRRPDECAASEDTAENTTDAQLSEDDSSTGISDSVPAESGTETMTIQVSGSDEVEEGVEVINAASMLAAPSETDTVVNIDMNKGRSDETSEIFVSNEIEQVEESITAATGNGETLQYSRATSPEFEESQEAVTIKTYLDHPDADTRPPELAIFSARDLCSIVWAATELRDSLRPHVTKIVAELFMDLGKQAVIELDAGDLSNLAWALAKSGVHKQIQSLTPLGEWISKSALSCMEDEDDLDLSPETLLEHFQPPELSKLMWSIASFLDPALLVAPGAPKQLSILALRAAASSSGLFETEDLARILWAFLDLHQFDVERPSPRATLDVGVLLATIETSLLFWESMTTSSVRQDEPEGEFERESVRFASFFGRTRFHFPLLDQTKDETSPEDLDEFFVPSKSRLPLLREIPVDPSTLCKLASSLFMYSGRIQNLDEAFIFSKVTVRLLASRSGRLLRACPVPDLVKLCNTVALSNAGINRETVGLFVRRLLRLLNEERRLLRTASAEERSTLLFSLGELGAKYATDSEDSASAYRRLQWIDPTHFLRLDDLKKISDDGLLKSIKGLVNLNVIEHDDAFLADCLLVLIDRLDSFSDPYGLAEALAMAKLSIPLGTSGFSDPGMARQVVRGKSSKCEEMVDDESNSSRETASPDNGLSNLQPTDIHEICIRALSLLANRLESEVASMSLIEIRRVLEVYSTAAVRSDALINSIRDELEQRKEGLMEISSVEVSDLANYAADCATEAHESLFGSSDNPDRFAAIGKRLVSFFQRDRDLPNEETADKENNLAEFEDAIESDETEQLQVQLEKALDSIRSLVACLRTMRSVSQTDLGKQCNDMCSTSLVELGRCEELLSLYDRIDFEAGIRKSRFDHQRRREMLKDVLTRLLPAR